MRLFLIGGFLGSGKTTAIVNACQYLMKDQRVAVITNDQGDQLVDSAFVKSFNIPSAEVTNGCFCCNYDQLDKHINSFIKDIEPDVIFAESVGSCTDLVATIAKPFKNAMTECSVIVSVFAEANLLLALFEGRASFIKENIRYIFKKQLEEADLLVVNKSDFVSPDELNRINNILLVEFPGKIILYQNSLDENDIRKWINTLYQFQQRSSFSSLEIDYDRYGDGEAQLAWLDKSILITAPHRNAFDIANETIRCIHDAIKRENLTIGHLKFFIETVNQKKKVSITTTSQLYNYQPQQNDAGQAHVLINARVQTKPSGLHDIVTDTLKQIVKKFDCNITVEKWSAFKPGYPKPTYRIT